MKISFYKWIAKVMFLESMCFEMLIFFIVYEHSKFLNLFLLYESVFYLKFEIIPKIIYKFYLVNNKIWIYSGSLKNLYIHLF